MPSRSCHAAPFRPEDADDLVRQLVIARIDVVQSSAAHIELEVGSQRSGALILNLTSVRDYQYHMPADEFSVATVQRRLVSLKCFGVWLVKRRVSATATRPRCSIEAPISW